ncbi:hypothetical protein JTE90_015245 [Oedothorax gibbosus]|uniref:Proteasome activator complex subunit 4 n=1 Tax=Oedothorax gibbosus TaxID=931172 RepID=A0AAV6TZZ7_9ARAC|nr:hypothetical protein JTE90_015245 [Oedothorax gibbosus]
MDERVEKLGFVPQKETLYNNLLQYADKLDEESQIYLAEIKTNLGKSILCQNLRDITVWINHLLKYIRLYGRKFSKEDHVHFIKVCFELLLIPDVELNFVKKLAMTLNTLLKKPELLSRDDLSLPWRPLYELSETIFNSSYEAIGMILIPCNLENNIKILIKACNRYFPVESTKEILEEFRPYMCPFDSEMSKAMNYFELLFTTTLPPSEHHLGFKLWFDELIELWQHWHNIPVWENVFLSLLSRLAHDNIGYIDWEPFIPMIFTRLLRSFNLPGRPSMVQVLRAVATFDISVVSTLIASLLGNGSSCQLHITRLFKAIESFYHPSNFGRWLVKMQKLLQKLPVAVIKRLHRERYKESNWLTSIPEHAKLTDQEVTEFVKSVVPVALLSMFSKRGSQDSAVALQNLGTLRPELVIPPLLDRLYSSLETLTEPHRLIAAMHCIVPLSRPLVERNKYFPEGQTHVIPLLMSSLPGIDPNDIKKSMVTFQFISTLSTLVLLIDCSPAANKEDLPKIKQEVCLATAAFEDFVLQFMDKIFVIIENSCLDNPSRLDRDSERTNPEENYLEVALYSTFGIVVMQSSPAIYQTVLSKLQTFITSHIFEINVSGKYAANLCRVVCKVNSEVGLQTFLPHFSKLVLSLAESDDILKEERLDDELLFSLLILSEIVRSNGKHLVKYNDYLIKVLDRALKLTCKDGYKLGCTILKHTLKTYVMLFPLETYSVPDPWNRHKADELEHFLDDWGKPGNIHDLKVDYHVPSAEETEAAKLLLERFLVPELENLRSWSLNSVDLTRDDVHRSLHVILNSLLGAAFVFPLWPEEHLQLRKSDLPTYKPKFLECGSKDIDINGKNARHYISEVLRQVLAYIIENCEDDTKSLFIIIRLYHSLVFTWGMEKEDFDTRWKSFGIIKNVIENKLQGQKKHIRTLLVDRVQLQHELRTTEKYKNFFSFTHQLLMKDLLKLATSHYSEVRKRAQIVLQNFFGYYGSSYRVVFPEILELLQKDPTECHEEFKGALYVIIGHKHNSILKMTNWEHLSKLLPAIVSSKHSEKPSIIKLLDSISIFLQKNMSTFQVKLMVPENCLSIAKCLWSENSPLPISTCFTEQEITQFIQNQVLESEKKERDYFTLVHSLINLLKNSSLHWRHYQLGLGMLVILVRPEVMIPKEGVELFVSHLIHDTLAIRKLAAQGMTCILKQQKRKHKKIQIDPTNQDPRNTALHPLMPKVDRTPPDNFWLLYNSANPPNTEEEWNSRHFVHKTHWGLSNWPKKFEVYAPDSEQPKHNRTLEDLTEVEKPIYQAFSQQKFVDSLISYFSLEEKKDHDKFDSKKYFLLKSVFANFGDTFLPLFYEHLHRMVGDKQESVQRCASEVICAIMSASKHWDFQQMHQLKDNMVPLFKKLVNNVTPETLNDWATCISMFSESRDPNKYYWVFEFFMQEPQSVENGSFLESSWLYLLTCLVSQQEWRVCELLHRAFEYLLPKLPHAYQNVREKLGSFLVYIFLYDIPLSGNIWPYVPKRVPFINSVMPKFDIILAKDEESAATEESPEKKDAKNLFLTICRWVSLNGSRTLYTAPPDVLQLLPLLCQVVHDSTDEGFQRECRVTMAILGQAFLNSESIDAAIRILQEIAAGSSWHARVSASAYLQTMVFSNLFNVMKNKRWTRDVYEMVLKLLQDENIEVRESASEALCGFLHCEYFEISDDLLNLFKDKCRKKLEHKNATITSNGLKSFPAEDLRERHAGVLGLCAIVNAFPYDVPQFLPDILVLLGDHLNDPQPISTTIKKTLSSFRRTHHDNWRDHKLKFTDDQLAVITDLLVSPSYYA